MKNRQVIKKLYVNAVLFCPDLASIATDEARRNNHKRVRLSPRARLKAPGLWNVSSAPYSHRRRLLAAFSTYHNLHPASCLNISSSVGAASNEWTLTFTQVLLWIGFDSCLDLRDIEHSQCRKVKLLVTWVINESLSFTMLCSGQPWPRSG